MASRKQIEIMKKLQESRKNGINAILRTASIEDFEIIINFVEEQLDSISDENKVEKIDSANMALIRVKNLLINCGVKEDISDTDSIDVGFSKYDLEEVGEN